MAPVQQKLQGVSQFRLRRVPPSAREEALQEVIANALVFATSAGYTQLYVENPQKLLAAVAAH
jgi:hypothetical protein